MKNTPENFRAGKTRLHTSAWNLITRDPWVLSHIAGVYPEFIVKPYQITPPNPIQFSEEEFKAIFTEIEELERKGVVRQIDEGHDNVMDPNQFFSNIFLRKKSNGSFRVILNLRNFNEVIKYTHFKMDSLQDALYLMHSKCFFTSVDIKDAYYSLPLHDKAKRFFRFKLGNKMFEFNSLVMGYSDAPRIFTKIMKPVLATLREDNIMIIMYIDDALIFGKTFDDCLQACCRVVKLFDSLGFTVHPDKSCLIPNQEIIFLGFILNSVSMTVRPTSEKIETVQRLCNDILKRDLISIRQLAEIIGKFISLTPGNRYGPLFCKRLEIFKNRALKEHKGIYDAKVSLNEEIREDIFWWAEMVGKYPVKLGPLSNGMMLSSDSSNYGWGGEHAGSRTGGLWSKREKSQHINCLELRAALLTLKAFTKDMDVSNSKVTILCDNTTAVSCINKMGSMKQECNEITREIWLWCIEKDIKLVAVHLPGSDNIAADEESRDKGLETEWALEKSVFNRIDQLYGPFDVDLFASRINRQIPCYVSWKKDAEAWRINAFSMSWSELYAYIFPPFNLILRILQKIEEDEAECALVIPVWKSQPWFAKLIPLLVDVPVLLPKSCNLLHHPVQESIPHPILRNSRMAVCRLSGKYSATQDFQTKLMTSSSHHGDLEPESNTHALSGSGFHFVMGSKKIPFRQLPPFY